MPYDQSINFTVRQINQGYSKKAFTLRGLHFQESCGEAARAVRYDSDFTWQTEPWPKAEYILSEKDKRAMRFKELM